VTGYLGKKRRDNLMELEEIFQSGWEVCLSPNAFVLSAPSKPEAFNLAYCKPEALAEWALRFGRGATLIIALRECVRTYITSVKNLYACPIQL
jgi:hypothetical protein